MGRLDFLSGPTWFTIANHASMEMKFRTVKCQPTSVTWRACENTDFWAPLPEFLVQEVWVGVLRICISDVFPGDATGPQTTVWGVLDQTLRNVLSVWAWAWVDRGVYHHVPLSPTGNPGRNAHVSEHKDPLEGNARSPPLCYLKHTLYQVTESRVAFQCSGSLCPVGGKNSQEQKEQLGGRALLWAPLWA